MRQPQQQNRRGRGRGRKPQNPLQRGYESNGPDVKLRGNASHIAEKYITLARDALSSGDTVMAENYLQHAEHYNRIIATAQQQQEANNQGSQGHASQQNNSSNGQNGAQQSSRGDGPQRGRRNQRNNNDNAEQASDQTVEQAAKTSEKTEAPAENTPVADEPAPKPRRKRAPRAKVAAAPASNDESADGAGPVRMGDIPMDEVTN